MPEDTERIEVPGGWWDVKTLVTRGMRKRFRSAGMKGFARGIDGRGDVDFSDGDALKKAIMANPEKWDLDAVDDAYMIEGTVTYSFGDTVSLETIDSLPDSAVTPVLKRMRELYAEMPEVVERSFFEKR